MGAALQQDNSGIWVVRFSGALRKEELDAIQVAALTGLAPGDDASVLILVEKDFSGWVGSEVWNDMTFFVEHGDRIAKMAIVGDAGWETQMLMFAGAGLRRAPVQYYTPGRLAEAYAWLGEVSSVGAV